MKNKTISKIFGILITISLICGIIYIPAITSSAAEAEVLASFEGETINYGRTFENLTTDEVNSWYVDTQKTNGGFRTWTENGVVTGYNGGKALSPVYGKTNDRSLEFYPIPEPTFGVQHIRFDYRAGTTEDKNSTIMLVYKSTDKFLAHAIKDTTALFGAEWVNVDIVINYEEKVWNVTAVPYNSSITTYTNNGTFDGNSLFIKFAYSSSSASSRNVDNTPAIDNFYWTTEDREENLATFEGETINYGRTFEQLTAAEVNSWYVDTQKTNGGFRSWTENGVVTGYNGGKALSPVYGKTNDRSLEFYPIPEPTFGVQHIRFDYRAGTTEDKNSTIMLVYKESDDFLAHAIKDTTALFGAEWVNVDIVINYEEKVWNVTAVPYNSSITTYTNNGTFDGNSLFIKFAYSSSSASSRNVDNTPAIDNFYWTTEDRKENLATFDGEKVNYGRTFEQLTASEVESWYTNDQKTNGGFRTWTENGIVAGCNSEIALSPVYGRTNAVRTLEFYPIPEPSNGIHHFRFDYKAGTTEDKSSNIMLVYKASDAFLAHAIKDTTALIGAEWFNVDIAINYDEKVWNVTAVPYNSSIATYTNNGTFDGNSLFIKFAYESSDGGSRTADNTPAIDNFYWTTDTTVGVSISGIVKDGEAVSAISELAAGDVVAVDLILRNITEEELNCTILAAYYGENDVLIKCDMVNNRAAYTVGDMTDVDEIVFFVWDSLGTIRPISNAPYVIQ